MDIWDNSADTWDVGNPGLGTINDLSCDHASIQVDADQSSSGTIAGPTCLLPAGADVTTGSNYSVCIVWDVANLEYSVYFDGALLFTYNGDIRSEFSDPTNVFWGFTGGSGGAALSLEVCNAVMLTNTTLLACTSCTPDDASFTLTDFCIGDANAATNIATPGGTFTFNPTPTDGASINSSTGEIITATSGTTYSVQYTTTVCPNVSTQTVTANAYPVIINPGSQTACDSYALPTILGTNLSGGQAYYDDSQTNGGSVIAGPITSSMTVYIYDANGTCSDEESFTVTINTSPVITNPGAQTACDSYALPTILGTDLSGGQAYYDDSQANGGSVITGPITSSQTVWIYDANGTCSDEESFTVTINNTPTYTVSGINPMSCNASDGGVVLSGLTPGGTYQVTYDDDAVSTGPTSFTADGSGNVTIGSLNAGTYDNIMVTLNGCTGTDATGTSLANPGAPDVDDIPNQTVCDSYTIPTTIAGNMLSGNQAYYDAPGGTGNVIAGGTVLTSSTTFYIYDIDGVCSDEEVVTITVNNTPVITNPGNQTACDSYALPTILGTDLSGGQAYYDDSQANGGNMIVGPITSSMTVYIYDSNGTCSDEESFSVTIDNTPAINNPGAQTACDSYALPTILGTDLSGGQAYYDDSQANGGSVITGPITSSQTVWIYDANGTCSDEESFTVTINNTPVITNPGTQTACDSYALPTILGTNLSGNQAYYDDSQANGGNVISGSITSSMTIYIYDNNGSCFDEQSFNITINNTPVITNPGNQTECVSYTLPSILGTNLSGNQAYYDDSQANGGNIISGPITTSQTVWIFDANGACSDETSFDVIINPQDDPFFSYPNTTMCLTGGNQLPDVVNSVPGTFAATGGLNIVASSGEIDVTVPGVGSYDVTYTTSGACPDSSTVSIVITDAPDATFSYNGPYCSGDGSATITFVPGASAGVFSSMPSLGSAINGATGEIDLTIAMPGTYVVTNFIAAAGGCASASVDTAITINAIDNASFTLTDYCEGSPNAAINIATSGGTFSFNPDLGDGAVIDAATGEIANGIGGTTYTVEYLTSGICPDSSIQTVTVGSGVFAGNDTVIDLCGSDAIIALFDAIGGTDNNGIWSGPSVLGNGFNGEFNPSTDTDGNYTYTVSGGGVCPDAAAIVTILVENPMASFVSSSDTGFEPLTVDFTNTSSGSSTYTWNLGEGTISNNTNEQATYTNVGNYFVELIAYQGACSDTAYSTITVEPYVDLTSELTMPNVFTPNGDNDNQLYKPIENNIDTFSMIIFNRWGQILSESNLINEGWDGRNSSGSEVPEGTYYFVVKATGLDGVNYDLTGFLTLIR